jgi:hypothetical protein
VLWVAPFVLQPSYTNLLYALLGVIGSLVFGIAGTRAWWRARTTSEEVSRLWLVGSILAIAPLVALAGWWILH